jgi:SAM-dependent methyltransferase
MPSLAELLEEAERRPLLGWDLSYGGRIGYAPPWDFEAVADEWIGRSPDLLDMGTGGGEWLSQRPFPKGRTVATEAWPPNVAVAQARLAPLGAALVAVEGAPDNADQSAASVLPALPFADAAFHLAVNRHESFAAAEVARVLAPNGRFVTQQVASDLGAPFRALLAATPRPAARPWTLAQAIGQIEARGLEITGCGEGAALITFADVGALAWYLIHVPWVMAEFSIARHREGLEALHGTGAMSAPQPMFWLAALKPA